MLRTYVYDLVATDPTVVGLGFATYPAVMAPDSPPERQFMVLRWGVSTAPLGTDTSMRRFDLTVWAYNRDSDYGPIDDVLKRVVGILSTLGGSNHGNGWITHVADNGCSEDLFDPAYEAVTKNWSFTITASEEA